MPNFTKKLADILIFFQATEFKDLKNINIFNIHGVKVELKVKRKQINCAKKDSVAK